jgi:hypothetical protein
VAVLAIRTQSDDTLTAEVKTHGSLTQAFEAILRKQIKAIEGAQEQLVALKERFESCREVAKNEMSAKASPAPEKSKPKAISREDKRRESTSDLDVGASPKDPSPASVSSFKDRFSRMKLSRSRGSDAADSRRGSLTDSTMGSRPSSFIETPSASRRGSKSNSQADPLKLAAESAERAEKLISILADRSTGVKVKEEDIRDIKGWSKEEAVRVSMIEKALGDLGRTSASAAYSYCKTDIDQKAYLDAEKVMLTIALTMKTPKITQSDLSIQIGEAIIKANPDAQISNPGVQPRAVSDVSAKRVTHSAKPLPAPPAVDIEASVASLIKRVSEKPDARRDSAHLQDMLARIDRSGVDVDVKARLRDQINERLTTLAVSSPAVSSSSNTASLAAALSGGDPALARDSLRKRSPHDPSAPTPPKIIVTAEEGGPSNTNTRQKFPSKAPPPPPGAKPTVVAGEPTTSPPRRKLT